MHIGCLLDTHLTPPPLPISGASEWEVEMAPVTSAANSETHGSHTLDNDSSSGSLSGGGGTGDALASGNDDLDEVGTVD
jgi:hypothetical protein